MNTYIVVVVIAHDRFCTISIIVVIVHDNIFIIVVVVADWFIAR